MKRPYRSCRVIKEREMREKLKKEKEEVRGLCVLIAIPSGSDLLASGSARRRRRKNAKRRRERNGRKKPSRRSVSIHLSCTSRV